MAKASNTVSLDEFARLTGRRPISQPPLKPDSSADDAPCRVLGVDTALRCTGYGVVQYSRGQLRAAEYGAIKSPASVPLTACLKLIHESIAGLLTRARPDAVAIEGIFFSRNVKTTVALGEARGVVLLACARAGIPVHEYPPRRVKQAIVGFGGAQKSQVSLMVAAILALPRPPQSDAADALALAICHLHNRSRHAMLMAETL
jgi:crossover junction endodeoxyribonuclease RuvC